jgi:hypothetical protein
MNVCGGEGIGSPYKDLIMGVEWEVTDVERVLGGNLKSQIDQDFITRNPK